MKTDEPTTIKESIPDFLRYSKVELGNCFGTVVKKKDCLSKIVSTGGNISVFDIDQFWVLDLKEKLMDEELSDSRISSLFSALKNFMKYLSEFVGLKVYNYEKITIPRVRGNPVEYWPEREIDGFIEWLPEKTLKEKRFKGLVAMLSDTGARISEILALQRDIELEAKEVTVLGKGRKFRKIYWGERTVKYVKNYLDARPEWDKSNYLFGTINNGNYGGKWDKGDINRTFRKISKQIGKRIHCHKFRSSFLTNCLHSGMNISAVSQAMGHSDIRTSMRYFSPMSDENTKQEFEKFFKSKICIEAKASIVKTI